jgi:hypothetical protein
MLRIQTLDLGTIGLLTILLANIDITCACATTVLADIGTPRANYRRKLELRVQLLYTGGNWHSACKLQAGDGILGATTYTGGNWHSACKLQERDGTPGATICTGGIGTLRANYCTGGRWNSGCKYTGGNWYST